MSTIKNVTIIGMGGLGTMFGYQIQNRIGRENVTFLMDEARYQKNKDAMPKPDDPNLILPGMKMEIPSLSGEFRDGVYSPSKSYDTYGLNR